jgi:hypothetical protein
VPTSFTVPVGLPHGRRGLRVVANGSASHEVEARVA